MFSANVIAMRAMHAEDRQAASMSANGCTGWAWSYSSTPAPSSPKPTGATTSGQPSIAAGDSASRGCHAAHASSTQPATQPRSVGRAVRVRADGGLVEVEAVADREDEQPGGDEAPRAVGPPAGDRERPDDHADQRQVEQRVGDVRRHAAREAPPSVSRIAGKITAVPAAPTARPLITPSNHRLERSSRTRERSSSTSAT